MASTAAKSPNRRVSARVSIARLMGGTQWEWGVADWYTRRVVRRPRPGLSRPRSESRAVASPEVTAGTLINGYWGLRLRHLRAMRPRSGSHGGESRPIGVRDVLARTVEQFFRPGELGVSVGSEVLSAATAFAAVACIFGQELELPFGQPICDNSRPRLLCALPVTGCQHRWDRPRGF